MDMPPPPIDGFFNVNKPAGMTSRDVVNRIQWSLRRATGNKKWKFGHTGTLDPLARGVMVVAAGSATRLTPWVLDHAKRYRGTFRLGVCSPSGDTETAAEPDDRPLPSRDALLKSTRVWLGEIQQTPPAHSAIKIGGERAHVRVRRGEDVQMPTRRVRIDRNDLVEFDPPHFKLDVVCSSGTYLRSLGRDVARTAGNTALMTDLVRTRVGPFRLEEAVDLDRLIESEEWSRWILPMTTALPHLERVVCTPQQAAALRSGQPIDRIVINRIEGGGEAAAVDTEGRLIAIVRVKHEAWWPHRVLSR